MADRHDITLREAEGGGPPGWLDEIKRAVGELFSESEHFGKNYLKGKGEAELAKAAEIKARVLTALGNLDLQRQSLIEQRDNAIRSEQADFAKAAMAHRQKMYELRTQRLKEVVEAAKTLKELGVTIDLTELAEEVVSAARNSPADQFRLEEEPPEIE